MTFEPPSSAPQPEEPETVAYTPEPERRPDWARSAWLDPAPGDPGPAMAAASAADPVATQPVAGPGPIPTGTTAQESRRVGLGTIVAASVLSAVLASGGTVVLLQSSGALVRPAAPGSSTAGNVPSGGTI